MWTLSLPAMIPCCWAARALARPQPCTRPLTRACASPYSRGGDLSTSRSPRPWCWARPCGKPVVSVQAHRLSLNDAGTAQAAASFKVTTEQGQVLEVGPKQHVEGIAYDRHRPKHRIKGGIGDHARDHPARRAQLACLPDEIAGHQRGDEVTRDRHQADEGIEAEADVGAWDDEGAIHQLGEGLQAGEGLFGSPPLEDVFSKSLPLHGPDAALWGLPEPLIWGGASARATPAGQGRAYSAASRARKPPDCRAQSPA